MVTDEGIGQNIKHLRERLGISQAELSARLTGAGLEGIYPQTVTKIEAGTRKISLREAPVFAEVLGASVENLYMATLDQALALARVANEVGRHFARIRESAIDMLDAQEALRAQLECWESETGTWHDAVQLKPEDAVREARAAWQELTCSEATSTPE